MWVNAWLKIMDLLEWLRAHGLEGYYDVLAQNEIDTDVLSHLTEDDLKEMGMQIGARRRLLSAISGAAAPVQGNPETPVDVSQVNQPQQHFPEEPPAVEPAPVAGPMEHNTAFAPPPPVTIPAPSFVDNSYSQAQPQIQHFDSKQLRPESKNSRKATSIIVAVAVHVVIAILASFFVIMQASKDEPEIVAVMAPVNTVKQEMKKRSVQKQVKKSPSSSSSAAAPMAMLMKANAMAKFTAPDVKITSTGPLGMGEGDLGNGGFGAGTGLGGDGMGGASFFGGTASGQRFLFVLDHSASMKDHQISLRNMELKKTLSTLKGVQYQVLLFAGPAFYAEKGWSVDGRSGTTVNGPGDKKYEFTRKKVSDYEFNGADSDLPRAKWLSSTPANVKKTMDFVQSTKKFGGTDWEMALRIGHYMEPPPDVIFFMADGTGGNSPPPILQVNQKRGRPVINTVAMQTGTGAAQFNAVAKGAKGTFTIVDKDGKPIKGEDFLKDPGKFKNRL